ncbi:GNAT family N-acetyltransferase [Pleomorphomonas sp. NRK JP5]|nr:GNAT family N-acetyltransferase [Pleomorphomonas sp. JP5]MCM5557399.1 GNAT family N-acetyltransferase [Pleomorphomonas sp. JP5]
MLSNDHDIGAFQSGESSLDDWLRDRALANMALGASRTFVSCQGGSRRVVGFYALAMGQILNQEAVGSVRRNMPRFIPAVVLGRLAVDAAWQGKGLGAALLKDAVLRALRAAGDVSARLVVVHAISPAAEAFYLRHGFKRLPVDAPALALDLLKLARL